ncbi:hypothetical protein GIB67_009583, partial [Kingdonia uniflora]
IFAERNGDNTVRNVRVKEVEDEMCFPGPALRPDKFRIARSDVTRFRTARWEFTLTVVENVGWIGFTLKFIGFTLLTAVDALRLVRTTYTRCYVLVNRHEESIKSAMFDVEPNVFDETWVMGSVKGFLCLSNSNDYLEFGDEQACYLNYIYNPLTRECVQLPQITFSVEHGVDIATGFGFVDSTNEFKVVKVISWGGESEVQVYTLGSTFWRKFESELFLNTNCGIAELLNGSLHWSNRNDGESVITSFDLKNEKWGVVHIPENMVLKDHSFYLGVLGGCLSIADCSFEDHIEIWIMKEYNVNESWARLFSVRNNSFGVFAEVVKPIAFRKNGEIVLQYNNRYLFSYNPKNKRCKSISRGPLQLINKSPCPLQVCLYSASSFHSSQYIEWRSNGGK